MNNYICVSCLQENRIEKELFENKDVLECTLCNSKYEIVNARPILLGKKSVELKEMANNSLMQCNYKAKQRIFEKPGYVWDKYMFPKLNKRDLQWRSLRSKTIEMVEKINAMGVLNTKILDIGAGNSRYGMLPFNSKTQYWSTDLAFTNTDDPPESLDFISTADALPVASDTFDFAFNFSVLEHVTNPSKCLEEMHRVLVPGGKAFLIFPLVRPEHMAPHDYQRFTRFWIMNESTRLGFEIIEIVPSNNILWTSFWYLYGAILTWPFERIKIRLFAIVLNRIMWLILCVPKICTRFFDKFFPNTMPIYYWVELHKK